MVKYAEDRRYLSSHEWAKMEGDEAVVGISDFAQHELSDVVYVELPQVGDEFAKGDQFATVESVKAASDVYMPLSGRVVAVNSALEDSPQLVNEDPFDEGWFVRISPSDPAEFDSLLDAATYQKQAEAEAKGE